MKQRITNRTPAEQRATLFRCSRPLVRKFVIKEGDAYTKDIGVLWAAYKAGSFAELPDDLDEAGFLLAIEEMQKAKGQVWMIDDFNPAYKDKRGPVAMACTSSEELVVMAEGCAFKWATKRNVLRCSTAFLHMIRRLRGTGICMVKCNKATTTLMKHLEKYRILHYVGRTAQDSYLYAARGSASGRA